MLSFTFKNFKNVEKLLLPYFFLKEFKRFFYYPYKIKNG